jgi:hypothetical protein
MQHRKSALRHGQVKEVKKKSYINYKLVYLQLKSGDQRPLKKRPVPKGYSGGETT